MKKLFLLILLLLVCNKSDFAQDTNELDLVNKIISLQKDLESIHPALSNLYPIAVYHDSTFNIYEFNSELKSYELVKTTPALRVVAKGIRAAFQLEENDYKMTCVVAMDAFDTIKDYSIIFHEFVHCYQAETVEYGLKADLSLYQKEMENENYMWELYYNFPYENSELQNLYDRLIENIDNENIDEAEKIHNTFKEKLNGFDYQYLCWVEWKEGSARWIENMIREKFDIDKNIAGRRNEFSRVSFYYGGSNYINLLSKKYNTNNLLNLFELIYKK